jgi:hypothetical protein
MVADLVAVKRIGRDDIQGYLALWGGADLEGEYFTAKTDFWDKVLTLPRPLTWDHAQDASMKADPIIGQIGEMGDDDLGRWYRATLQRNHQYRTMVDNLINQRAVGTSSDSAPQYIIREPQADGKAVWLKRWPLFAGALTASPCEPRMLDEGALHWKSIADELPRITLALDSAKGGPDGLALDSADVERLRLWFDYLKLR